MSDSWLIFVDTNVFLDFYRLPGESAKRQLALLEKHKDSLIIGDQVRMEFLKNRQKVIVSSIQQMKAPDNPKMPQVLAEAKSAKALSKALDTAKRHSKGVKDRANKILSEPHRYDPVFTTFSRIFNAKTSYNLTRTKEVRFEIRELAQKRFLLGYPPRKSSDTSIGDALNWEWVIRCAQSCPEGANILIVSRDGDYGQQLDGTAYLNDWLMREFKDRVSQKRKIRLTTKLTDALSVLDEVVNPEDEEAEKVVINASKANKIPQRNNRFHNEGTDIGLIELDEINRLVGSDIFENDLID